MSSSVVDVEAAVVVVGVHAGDLHLVPGPALVAQVAQKNEVLGLGKTTHGHLDN